MKIKVIKIIKLTLILKFTTFTCLAQWSNNTGVNNPICNDPGYQISPFAVSDGNGGAIIAWKDGRATGNQYYALYAQRIDVNGIIQWTNNGVPICTLLNDNSPPEIIADGNGGAIFTWKDSRNGTDNNIYAQRINSNGVIQWTANGVQVCTASYDQIDPKIISDNNGGAIITWQDYRNNTDWDVYAQKIDSDGVVQWTNNGTPISLAVNNQYSPSIVTDGNGGAIIAWRDERNRVGTPGIDARIWGQHINTNGTSLWSTNGIVLMPNFGPTTPVMVTDGNGGAIIFWEDYRFGVLNKTIYSQRIDSNGTKLWTSAGVVICSTQTFASKEFDIISDNNGGAIITWDFRPGSTEWDIFAQKINSAGIIQWTPDGVVVSGAVDRQDAPAITTDGNGGAIITWEDRRSGTTYIYAQNISSNGIAQWTPNGVLVSNLSPYDFGPEIAANNSGGAIITWTRSSGNSSIGDIYAQNINATGTLSVKNQAAGTASIKLFPNPTTGFITIQSYATISDITIINELGQFVYRETSINSEIKEIDLSKLPRGLYMYKLTSVDGLISDGKIIIAN